jgi:hypothetical protein
MRAQPGPRELTLTRDPAYVPGPRDLTLTRDPAYVPVDADVGPGLRT